MGVEIRVEGLTKVFGKQTIFEDVSLTIPAGEISVMLGPSGTGKSVFLKHLVGLLKPTRGHVYVAGKDVPNLSEHELYETRKLFGVLFQDGALFGSMTIYDNVAFPLREHTNKSEQEIKRIVSEKLEMTGLKGAEQKLPGQISGGMRKRAGLARALVLDPEIMLFDEPDSGLDPVRVAYLNQLIVDLNAQIGATFLIVTHDIGTARTVPDNIGLLFRRRLVMFGPREELLNSDEPVVRQFLNGRMEGPIGMAEEKDAAVVQEELARLEQSGLERRLGIPGPKGATGDGVPQQQRPSVKVLDKSIKVPEEPTEATADATAILAEREMAPESGGPLFEPRVPIDRRTGEPLVRPESLAEEDYKERYGGDETQPQPIADIDGGDGKKPRKRAAKQAARKTSDGRTTRKSTARKSSSRDSAGRAKTRE